MKSRERPIVLITTYSSSNYRMIENAPSNQVQEQDQQRQQQICGSANEDSDRSYNLFTATITTSESFSEPATRLASCKASKLLCETNQIKGPNGSVRGYRDVVKKSLESIRADAFKGCMRNFASQHLVTFNSREQKHLSQLYKREYLDRLFLEEKGLCVVYTTTLGIIRRTYEDSKQMRSILNLNLVKFEERDIYLNQEYKEQLRMRCKSITVPVLFINGELVADIRGVESMNESGKLASLLANFKMLQPQTDVCGCCGNARFIACQSCHGSRRSTIHHFKFNSIALRCIKCDRNDGLVQCPACSVANKTCVGLNQVDENNNNKNH